MKPVQVWIAALLFAAFAAFALPAMAQDKQKCEGPAELCAQIAQLQDALAKKAAAVPPEVVNDKVAKAKADEAAADEAAKSARMKKIIAASAGLAVALKILISILNAWQGYFNTDKQKAALKLSMVAIGLAIFLATNIGFGIPWWQALILAGGGPGAVAVHEFGKFLPVLFGKAPLPPDTDKSAPVVNIGGVATEIVSPDPPGA